MNVVEDMRRIVRERCREFCAGAYEFHNFAFFVFPNDVAGEHVSIAWFSPQYRLPQKGGSRLHARDLIAMLLENTPPTAAVSCTSLKATPDLQAYWNAHTREWVKNGRLVANDGPAASD